jgi:hypothetical protein
MICSLPRSLARGCALLLGAGGVAAQDAPAASTPPPSEDRAQQPAPDSSAAAEDKRICRYVKLDASSRRKTKLCRTTEEWRALNNIR